MSTDRTRFDLGTELVDNAETAAHDVAPADAAEVTARLDQVYASEPSALEPDVRNALRRTFARNDW